LDAAVLAERNDAVDPRRQLAAAASAAVFKLPDFAVVQNVAIGRFC
jgi:hypothetical protein